MTIIRVVDFETTGTEPPAEVCEVGYCDFDLQAFEVYDPEAWLCAVKTMPPEVRAVHHITLAECEPYNPFDPSLIAEGRNVWTSCRLSCASSSPCVPNTPAGPALTA